MGVAMHTDEYGEVHRWVGINKNEQSLAREKNAIAWAISYIIISGFSKRGYNV